MLLQGIAPHAAAASIEQEAAHIFRIGTSRAGSDTVLNG